MYMAMQSGNLVIPDKMLFPAGGAVIPAGGAIAGGGGGIGWYPDERDSFISWLRGEFAAANAIIDSMCQHLKSIGEVGEYDGVIGSVQQRRCNWNPVLHMQHYYSVAEVLDSLQQVSWRRQQRQQNRGFYDQGKGVGNGKEYKRSGSGVGFRQGHGNGHSSNGEIKSPRNVANGSGNLVGPKSDEKNDGNLLFTISY